MADDIDNLLSMLDRAIQESHDPKQIRAYENAKDILKDIRAKRLNYTTEGLLTVLAQALPRRD